MPRNVYPTESEAELLKIRKDLMQARRRGSAKSVGIEPRISHEFNGVSWEQLGLMLDEVDYALYLLAIKAAKQGDHSRLEIYRNPYDRPNITRMNFC